MRKQIQVRDARPPLVVISRSHADAELKEYLQQLGEHQTTSIGSSLKFCLVAEGQAQLYPRFGPTNIWDTAAGHAVAAAAGAHVHDWQGKPLDYTPRESFLNPGVQSVYLLIKFMQQVHHLLHLFLSKRPVIWPIARDRLYPAPLQRNFLHPAARHRVRRHCYQQ